MEQHTKHILILLFTCTLAACTCGNKNKVSTEDAPSPVEISKSLFYNGDSLRYYAALAYKDDDSKGLYVTAAASILSGQDPDFPDSIYTVPIDEAEIFARLNSAILMLLPLSIALPIKVSGTILFLNKTI